MRAHSRDWIEALRAAISLTDDRAKGNERRALAEIEIARRQAIESAKAMSSERKRLEAENTRNKKAIEKRDAQIGKLRDCLARSDASLAQVSGHLKAEQGKFSKLLSRVQSGSTARPRTGRRPAGPATRKRISK